MGTTVLSNKGCVVLVAFLAVFFFLVMKPLGQNYKKKILGKDSSYSRSISRTKPYIDSLKSRFSSPATTGSVDNKDKD